VLTTALYASLQQAPILCHARLDLRKFHFLMASPLCVFAFDLPSALALLLGLAGHQLVDLFGGEQWPCCTRMAGLCAALAPVAFLARPLAHRGRVA